MRPKTTDNVYTEGQVASKRNWYERNKQYVMDRNAEREAAIRQAIWEYKLEHPCLVCGFENPAALQFHHRDPEEKEINIATAIKKGWPLYRIMTEIEKCDVLCANCHSIEHYNQRAALV